MRAVLPRVDAYAHLASPLHAWDPRWKAVGLGGLLAVLPFLRAPAVTLAALALSLTLFRAARLPASVAWGRLRWLYLFLVPFCTLLLLTGGGSVVHAGPVPLSLRGGRHAWRVFCNAQSALLAAVVFLESGSLDRNLKALRALGLPSRLVAFIGFTYRYLFVFEQDLMRTRVAMRARGHRLRFAPSSLGALGGVVGALLVRSVARSERILRAMRARGFRGRLVVAGRFRTRPADVGKTVLLLAAAVLLVSWQWSSGGGG